MKTDENLKTKAEIANERAEKMLSIAEEGLVEGHMLSGKAVSGLLRYFSGIPPTERASTYNRFVILMNGRGYVRYEDS